jgi:hypothetical protein
MSSAGPAAGGGAPLAAAPKGSRIAESRMGIMAIMVLICSGVMWLLSLAGIALLIGALATFSQGGIGQGGSGLFFVVMGPALIGLGVWAGRGMWRMFRRASGGHGLIAVVNRDQMALMTDHGVTNLVERGEVGLVVIHAVRSGVDRLTVWGPDQNLVGEWSTGWVKGPLRAIRVFRREGWPWVLHDTGAAVGRTAVRSASVPAWTDSVLSR